MASFDCQKWCSGWGMFILSIMPWCSLPIFTSWAQVFTSATHFSLRSASSGLWPWKKGALQQQNGHISLNHISASRGSTENMDNCPCLSGHKPRRKHYIGFLRAVCSCCQGCTFLWSPRPERSVLPNLSDIYTFKMLHQMKHLRTNYTGFNTTLLLTNLWHFPISSYCFKSDERLCCHLAWNWH